MKKKTRQVKIKAKLMREYHAGAAVYGEIHDQTLWPRIPYSEQLPYIRAAIAAIKAAGLKIQ